MKTKSTILRYSIGMNDRENHYFNIGIELKNIDKKKRYIDLKIPTWRPGRYLILEFASSIEDFEAKDCNGTALKWEKIDKCTWRVFAKAGSSIFVSYRVYANEFELRTKGLDLNHAFINPAALFMYSERFRDKPILLEVKPNSGWHATTGMECLGNNIYAAANYDTFSDSPLEIGNQKDYDFYVEGSKHTISIFGEANYDIEKLIRDFALIIRTNYEFWRKVPYGNYVFIIHCTPQGGGGTEHLNSTVVGVKPVAFDSEKGYLSFLRLISHEFFHTWNVKQLKPSGLTPYDFVKENYTSELWIAEGATSYYDGLILRRTGLMSSEEFLEEISSNMKDERTRPGYRKQSVADSSFDAWIKFWRPSPNAYRTQSNYYTMGSYVCMVLDLEIRNASKNKFSLDDVFRFMLRKFPLNEGGYTNKDFRKACEKFSGISLKQFFKDHVFGTKSIDWERHLLYAGIFPEVNIQTEPKPAGLLIDNSSGNNIVSSVLQWSPADKAGIIRGDHIIACNDLVLTSEELEDKIRTIQGGESISLSVFRAGKLLKFPLKIPETNFTSYKIRKIDKPSDLQRSIYEGWLNARW